MNVVMICLDTFRADCLAAAGRNDFIKTPNLDRLASEGVLFENAFGEGQPTIQFRRALVTGMRGFPFNTGYDTKGLWPCSAGWHKIPPEQPTLAEVLLAEGYATGLVADTYHMFKPTQNFVRGMASWEFIRGQETDNYRTGPFSAIDVTKYTKKGLTKPGNFGAIVQYLLNMQDHRGGEDETLAARTFSSAIRYLDDNKGNRPFFLWLDEFDPHEPFDPPTEYADAYDPDWDEDWEPIHGVPDDCDEKIKRRVKALYYGSVTFVDKQVGRLLDKLEETGLADETMVIVCSDHGLELWDHGILHKGENKCRYRPNNEILFMMRLPGKEYAGKRIKSFVMNQDIYPTILSMLGVSHTPVDGIDLMPLVRGEVDKVRDFIVGGWAGGGSGVMACVRDHDWNYSCDYHDENLNEHLFDLKADPGEFNNVAADHVDVVTRMRGRLEGFLGEALPATRRDTLFYTKSPCNAWLEKADWAKELREMI